MTEPNWKKTYSTWYLTAVAVVGAVTAAVNSLENISLPAWVIPVLGAVGVFLRALPQAEKKD